MRRNCTRFIVMSAMLFCAATAFAQDIHLNEIYASHAGTDDQEMIELFGTPDMVLDNLMVLIVEGDSTNAGILDRAWDLTGYVMPSDGYFLMGDTAVPGIDYDLGSDNNIENGTETFYLVQANDPADITALLGTNIDPDEDGITVIPDLAVILDIIAMVDGDYPAEDMIYDGTDFRGPDGSYFPAGIFRGLDYPNDWCLSFLDFDAKIAGNPVSSVADSRADMAGQIDTLMHNDEIWRLAGLRANEYFSRYHSIEATVSRYEHLFADMKNCG